MDDQRTAKLLAEYHANVELWKHDDALRQQRTGNFLAVNTALLVALGAFVSLGESMGVIMAVPMAVFGMVVCLLWRRIHVRNAEYVRFRRFQLRALEARLGDMSTFTSTYRAFYETQRVSFPEIGDEFVVDRRARSRSTAAENVLPLVLSAFWTVVFVAAVVVLAAAAP